MAPGQRRAAALRRFSRIGSLVVICIGAFVACGWLLDVSFLKVAIPGLETMKMNTACAFILAGVILWLLNTSAAEFKTHRLTRPLALFLTALAALTLAEDLFAVDFGIDQLIMPDAATTSHSIYPGRMSPITSFNFTVIGIALLGLKARQRLVAACAHWMLLVPLFISMLGIVGYAYGISALYQVKSFNSIAPSTALAFFLLTLSIKAADPMHGIANIMTSSTAGGTVARRLLPTILVALIAIGWLCVEGQEAGHFSTAFGLALMATLSVAVCFTAIVPTAYALRRVDLTRERAEAEIGALNTGLEKLADERRKQIARLAAALEKNKSLERDSLHDALTGIPNRRFLDAYLSREIAIARRHRRMLALVMCDIDEFKSYNDHYGHLAGDECLKMVATAIRSSCQRPGDMAARYGGEEFALVLPDTDLAGAARIAEIAREAVARLGIPHDHSSVQANVSISGGVATLSRHHDMSAAELIINADRSLYQAKHEGRNRIISAQAEAA